MIEQTPVNYDIFSDEQSIIDDNVGGGVEIAFTDGLKLHLFAQYSDIFRDSYEGYSGIVHLSYTWTEDLSLSSGVSAREEESLWGIRLERAL